jgi:hypothetical protein
MSSCTTDYQKQRLVEIDEFVRANPKEWKLLLMPMVLYWNEQLTNRKTENMTPQEIISGFERGVADKKIGPKSVSRVFDLVEKIEENKLSKSDNRVLARYNEIRAYLIEATNGCHS